MTKKDYKKLAHILRLHRNRFINLNKAYFVNLVDDFCVVLKQDNGRFNKSKFIEAIFVDEIEACEAHQAI